jgi:hypothetical protein
MTACDLAAVAEIVVVVNNIAGTPPAARPASFEFESQSKSGIIRAMAIDQKAREENT